MKVITNYQEALDLMFKHSKTIVSKPYGSKPIMYAKFNDMVLVINNNLKSYITKDEFIEHFFQSTFYLVDIEVNETEIDQVHIVYRQ